MRRQIVTTLTLFFLSVAAVPTAARAGLQRVGPSDPGNGYPAWYQDSTGLALEFCGPKTQNELVDANNGAGWCLILPPDVPLGTAPESFPGNFAEEHFYWHGAAHFDVAGNVQNRALLVMGIEAAFAAGPVIAGDQMTFGRVRVTVNSLPVDGTYTVYHPYGKWVFPDQTAGSKLFYTEDIGVNCARGVFDCALATHIGPFLLPSVTPGGPELPPIPILQYGSGVDPYYDQLQPPSSYPGNVAARAPKYIADPARIGPVTGSPLTSFTGADGVVRNHNWFLIEVAPADGSPAYVLGETSHFDLVGRIFEGTVPGKVQLDRASYTVPVTTSATAGKLDVFATAFSAMPARVPPNAPPAVGAPALRFYDEACAADPVTGAIVGAPPGETPRQMLASGSRYWGQSPPCELDPVTGAVIVPVAVCVEQTNAIAGGQQASVFYQAPVIDEVTVTEATYDYRTTTLAVAASSSDLLDPPTLVLTGFGELVNGAFQSTALPPPATAQVSSTARRPLAYGNKGGIGEMQVYMGAGDFAAPTFPVAVNDLVTTVEDTALPVIDVLANDTYLAGPIAFGANVTVTVVNPPRLGTAVLNPDGTIGYTPAPDRFGTDGFAYQVTVDGQVSNIAGVTVVITGVNDAPVAAADAAATVQNLPVTINVMANDTDPDGFADLVAAVNLSATTPATATVTALGGTVTFNATAPGTYTFAYQIQDTAGELSPPATVTVTVAATETITITPPVEFRIAAARWVIAGTDTPAAGQTLDIRYADGPYAGFLLAQVPVDALGGWAYDVRSVTGLYDPRAAGATQITVTGPAGGAASAPITIR